MGFLSKLIGGRKSELKAEIARLEAFLSAMPGAYCGWSAKGELAYSPDFPVLLGLEQIKDINDIYNALTPTDSAALEGYFTALRNKGTDFTYEARTEDKTKVLYFTGQRGRNLALNVSYDILCVNDMTAVYAEKNELSDARDRAEDSEDYFKAILDTVPIPISMVSGQGQLEWVNRFYAECLEATRERVIEEQLFFKFGSNKNKKDPVSTVQALCALAIDTGERQIQESHIVLHGQRRLLRFVATAMPGRDAVICMTKDITAQEDAELATQQSIQNATALFEQIQSAIAFFDPDESLEYYNPEFSRLWDLEESWLNQHPKLSEIMERLRDMRRLPEQADFRSFKQSWLSLFTEVFETKEDLLHLPDSRTVRKLCIPRPTGGLIMTFEDVTSSLELESSYNTLMAVQKESLDNLAEGVAVFGGDGRLKLYNPTYAKIWNIPPEDLSGEPHITKLVDKKKPIFADERWQEARNLLMRHALDRTSREDNLELADGTVVLVYTVPLPDGGVMITYGDITATIHVETALLEKNAALETAERLKLDFLANVSYQLRTPLNAIMGFSDILANQYFGPLNERQEEYTSGIGEAGKRLLSLIDDILDLSTIEAGYLELHTDTVNVSSMLDNIYNLTQEWARKESIRVELDCPKTIGKIDADERRLKQILLNLIRNAITFTPEDGKITIKAQKDKAFGGVIISVSDTGPGIKIEDQTRIFEPFQRGSSTKQNNTGVGLGLSLVKNIVELHGGKVELESEMGKGTTVLLYIPSKVKSDHNVVAA
jgi:signal transduction histidine kinase